MQILVAQILLGLLQLDQLHEPMHVLDEIAPLILHHVRNRLGNVANRKRAGRHAPRQSDRATCCS